MKDGTPKYFCTGTDTGKDDCDGCIVNDDYLKSNIKANIVAAQLIHDILKTLNTFAYQNLRSKGNEFCAELYQGYLAEFINMQSDVRICIVESLLEEFQNPELRCRQ